MGLKACKQNHNYEKIKQAYYIMFMKLIKKVKSTVRLIKCALCLFTCNNKNSTDIVLTLNNTVG